MRKEIYFQISYVKVVIAKCLKLATKAYNIAKAYQ